MSGLLSGKVIIVTGGGNGIGRAAAGLFAREGAIVLIGDIDEAAARKVADAATAARGTAVGVRCDIRREDEVVRLVAAALERWGRLDGAFNNAGIGAAETSLTDDTIAEWQRILDVDLFGTMLCLKH